MCLLENVVVISKCINGKTEFLQLKSSHICGFSEYMISSGVVWNVWLFISR
jgi:hypothetical protein